jgi:hypothetical protein
MWAFLIAWVLATSAAWAQEPEPADDEPTAEAPSKKERPLQWYIMPNVAFDTDDGLGFGGRLELNWGSDRADPYKASLVLQAYWTVRGYHHHRFRVDLVDLGAEGRFRLTTHLAFRAWMNDGYWGIGPGATVESEYAGTYEADDPRRKRYRYSLIQPFSHIVLRAKLQDPWLAYGALDVRWSWVRAYPGSLLEEQQPYGMEGGWTPQLALGILRDTRLPEVSPREGTLVEASMRAAPPMPGGAGAFVGFFGSLRWFESVGDRGVVAVRLMGEYLFGQVPFYEMVHWGGLEPIPGYGGASTLRGLKFGRFRGPGKALLNVEARIDSFTHNLLKKPVLWQTVPFLDVGTVFGAGDQNPRLTNLPFHPSVGLGLRPIWDEVFVGRIDLAVGANPVDYGGPTPKLEPYVGFYLMFEHLY